MTRFAVISVAVTTKLTIVSLSQLLYQLDTCHTLLLLGFVNYSLIVFRGIYRLNRQSLNLTQVEMIGDAVFARITDLKYIEQIGKTFTKSYFVKCAIITLFLRFIPQLI